MQSLKNIAVVKTAVAVCFFPELKREILCSRGSEFDVTKSRHQYCRKEQWNAIIRKKAREILRRQGLATVLADAVLDLLPAIGLKMLIWAEYHEGTLGLTRDFSVNFLSYSHVTREGAVDNAKAAEDLMEYGNMSLKQKYKLACLYCFKYNIGPLYTEIVRNHGKDAFYRDSNTKWFRKPDIVSFWTQHQTYKMERIDPYVCRSFYMRMLRDAIRSGSKAAVIYSWAKRFSSQREVLICAAREILEYRNLFPHDDWIIFRDSRYDDVKDYWFSTEYSDDILRFIFLKVIELQQQGGLQVDDNFSDMKCVYGTQYNSLELFLRWPHGEYFMKIATSMWDFMSEQTYADVLLKICDRIEPRKYQNLQYGEENCYDYRYILKEFWRESPDSLKRDFFNCSGFIFERDNRYDLAAKGVLLKLFSLKKFTLEDEEIARSILGSATDEEKEYLLSTMCWKNSIVNMMQDEKFETFDRFLRVCFRSKLQADMFKEKLNLYAEARNICKKFLKYRKLNAIKSFLNRISVTEYQLECLKFDLIYSPEGRLKCLEILFYDGSKAFEKFLGFFFPTEESAVAFKRALTMENSCDVPHLQQEKLFELVDQYSKSQEVTQATIRHLDESIIDVFGLQICEELICGHSLQAVSEVGCSSLYAKSNFRGGQWEKLGQFLSPLPATKVVPFKKMVYKKASARILFKLIKAKQWTETERFLDWLELSEEQIKQLKSNALTAPGFTRELFCELVFSESVDEADRVERIYAMLKWHLTDIKGVLNFHHIFLGVYLKYYDEACLNVLTSVVDMYLDKLDKKRSVNLNACVRSERKQNVPAPSKKARLSQTGLEKEQNKNGTVVVKSRRSQRLLDKANKK